MKVLIDTCVVLDVLQKREPFFAEAREVFLAAARNRIVGCISAKSVTDIYYLTHRLLHSNEASRKVLGDLFKLFALIDSTGEVCRRALVSDMSDYEDAVMAQSAARSGCDVIVSRNLKDYESSPVPAKSPGELLEMLDE